MKIKGVIEDFNFFFNFTNDNDISRDFSGVVTVWVKFSFRQPLVPAYTSQYL